MDSRQPLIAGVAQLVARPSDGETPDPLTMMERVARAAAEDSGAADALLRCVRSISVVECFSWPVPDPGRALAQRLGIESCETARSARGGNGPQALVADVAARIQAGQLDAALVVGAEAMTPFMRAVRAGQDLGWTRQPADAAPDRIVGEDRTPSHPGELAAGLLAPITYYPLVETALRGAAGTGPSEHRDSIARLWSRFSEVAAGHPYAWSPAVRDASEIATATPENRMVAEPYTKWMTANIQVDQAAALLLCSSEVADAVGVPLDRRVFPAAAAGAHDHWHVGERASLHRSPALAAAGEAALAHSGLQIGELAHVDLYSCFPSAVQVAASELGVRLDNGRQVPTLTGGLTFFGGPANNYVTHSIATLVERLREDQGSGMTTGVGWYLTKHAVGVYSSTPPNRPFASISVQEKVDAEPRREIALGWSGTAAVEAYTAIYDRDGAATIGIVCSLTPEGARSFAKSEDRDTIASLLGGEPLGSSVLHAGDGTFVLP